MIQIGSGLSRTFSFNFGLFVIIHIIACLWIIVSKLDLVGSWLDNETINEMKGEEVYLTAVYFTITTLTTVGYGDMSASTNTEKVFLSIFMMISFAILTLSIGNITSLL